MRETIRGPLGISWNESPVSPRRPLNKVRRLFCRATQHRAVWIKGFESQRGNGYMEGFCGRCGVGLSYGYGPFPAFIQEDDA